MAANQLLGNNKNFASKARVNIFRMLIILMALVFVGRLAQLQIIEVQLYKQESETQAIKKIIVEPFRGNMYDHDGNLIVHNKPSFSVTLTPNDFNINTMPFLLSIIPGDTMEILKAVSVLYSDSEVERRIIPMLDTLLNINSDSLKRRSFNPGFYTRFTPIKIYRDASFEEISMLEEYNDYLPGIDVIVEPKRLYQFEGNMAHILGYTREISPKQLESKEYLRPGDKIGQRGLEKSYESLLHGSKGVQFVAVNSSGKKISSFEKGKRDIASTNGSDLYLSIKTNVQHKAEELLDGYRGAAVAVDPRNGEVLAMASSPDFDPRRFSGKISQKYYNSVMSDTGKPMYNRCVQSTNSPGSTWKILVAIAALSEGIIDDNTSFYCPGGMHYGGRFAKCNGAHGNVSVRRAIQVSCNTFFYKVGLKLGIDNFEKYGNMFGFGKLTGIDLPGEAKGLMPSEEWLDEHTPGGFTRGKLMNYGIGQGEILVTPLQMAVYTAAIANGGVVHQPHFVRKIRNNITNKLEPLEYQSRQLPIDSAIFDISQKGMHDVVNVPGGTARSARLSEVKVCGKTGTAQNPHGKDHAWFICFAPLEKPEIAITVLVENSGFGSVFAAPIAKKMLEEYFFPGRDEKKAKKTEQPRDSVDVEESQPDTTSTPITLN